MVLICRKGVLVMILKTRVFELYNKKYNDLPELADAMGLSVSQIYRIRDGTRKINHQFIVGAITALPDYKLDELFYLVSEASTNLSE